MEAYVFVESFESMELMDHFWNREKDGFIDVECHRSEESPTRQDRFASLCLKTAGCGNILAASSLCGVA